jgi:hypothetical protein
MVRMEKLTSDLHGPLLISSSTKVVVLAWLGISEVMLTVGLDVVQSPLHPPHILSQSSLPVVSHDIKMTSNDDP